MKTRTIAVVDYGTGNLRSVVKAFECLGAKVKLSRNPNEMDDADALVFPGQGSFDQCMSSLSETGMEQSIRSWILENRPFFGICLGLQVLFGKSEEGCLPGLGIFSGKVVRFNIGKQYKIPHMGWNQVTWNLPETHWIRQGIVDSDQFYFVHSYHVQTSDSRLQDFTTEYGVPFTSGIFSGKCLATQFHPEKSQSKGMQLYRNFLENIE